MRASAARGLNEPVFWRCSAFRYRRPSPIRVRAAASANRAAVTDESSGVWCTRPCRRVRMSRIAARVIGASLTA